MIPTALILTLALRTAPVEAPPTFDPAFRDDPDAYARFVEECLGWMEDGRTVGHANACVSFAFDPDSRPVSAEVAAAAARPLREALRSDDWDVRNAAALWAGRLGARELIADLDALADDHWNAAVRGRAQTVAEALWSETGRISPGAALKMSAPEPRLCETHAWRWREHLFTGGPTTREPWIWRPVAALRMQDPADGWLVGTDTGDRPGALVWMPVGESQAQTVIDHANISALRRDGGTVLAVGGYGEPRVDWLRWDGERWRAEPLAIVAHETFGLRGLGDGLYAVYGPEGATVFNDDEILGEAACLSLTAR